jgi:hypothetical protein
MTGDDDKPLDRAIDVALAEYNALRVEITAAQTTSATAVGLGLTAVGVLGTFALQDDGDRLLLATVPFVALIVCLLHLNELARIFRIGDYIHAEVWPFLTRQTGYPSSWEQHAHSEARDWSPSAVALHLALDGGTPLLLAALGGASLTYSRASGALLVCGWLATAATLAFPLAFARNRRRIGLDRRPAGKS